MKLGHRREGLGGEAPPDRLLGEEERIAGVSRAPLHERPEASLALSPLPLASAGLTAAGR